MIVRGGEVTWQHWERQGVGSGTLKKVGAQHKKVTSGSP
jgi:hypothetical protein